MTVSYAVSKRLIWKILRRVSKDLEIDEQLLRSKRRYRELVECRAIISKVATELGCIHVQIANVLRRDRSTIDHYLSEAEIEAERDIRFSNYIHELIEEYKP